MGTHWDSAVAGLVPRPLPRRIPGRVGAGALKAILQMEALGAQVTGDLAIAGLDTQGLNK